MGWQKLDLKMLNQQDSRNHHGRAHSLVSFTPSSKCLLPRLLHRRAYVFMASCLLARMCCGTSMRTALPLARSVDAGVCRHA